MNQEQKQQLLNDSILKLKRAAQLADTMRDSPIRPETASSLWQLSSEALCAVTAFRSAVAGNESPKSGG